MSDIKFQANTSGTGTVTLASPNTNNDRTLVVPDVTGNVVVSDGSLITASYGASTLAFGGTVDFRSATVKGVGAWKIQGASGTLSVSDNVFANTRAGALTLTLPASASKGDTIRVIDNEGLCSSNNITIARNGHNIDGSARNVVLNVDRQGILLVYESTRNGWISKKREKQARGFQGEVSGYSSGGDTPTTVDTIDKYPFVSDANATDVGNLFEAREIAAGQSSLTHGYTTGGDPSVGPYSATIDKFPFAVDTNATDVGDLFEARRTMSGHSSDISGYTSAGFVPDVTDTIDKFPFASDTNATDVGNLFQARREATGQSSSTHGYASGGRAVSNGARLDTVDKFPFAVDGNATDVGNLTVARDRPAGQSSTTHGYSSGGYNTPPTSFTNVVDRFPFASDADATDVLNLTQARSNAAGQSSTISGYSSGGEDSGATQRNTIDKFPFATNSDATDVGNLFQTRRFPAGQQS